MSSFGQAYRSVQGDPTHHLGMGEVQGLAPHLPDARVRLEPDLADEVGEAPAPYLRRLRSRLTKMDGTTIADLTAYSTTMWFLSAQMERHAVDEFTRLMSAPSVRARIAGFAENQTYPWETTRAGGAWR